MISTEQAIQAPIRNDSQETETDGRKDSLRKYIDYIFADQQAELESRASDRGLDVGMNPENGQISHSKQANPIYKKVDINWLNTNQSAAEVHVQFNDWMFGLNDSVVTYRLKVEYKNGRWTRSD
jgi:hypothetical protein